MSVTPALQLPAPAPDPDQAWKNEARSPDFIKDIEANVAQLQSCQALLQNREDALAFVEIFKKDIAVLRLVSTEGGAPKEAPLWGKCDEIEHKLHAIATQVSKVATGLPAPAEPKAPPAPSQASASGGQPSPQQKPAGGDQKAPDAGPGGLWGGFGQLLSQVGHYAPIFLGGIGAIAAAIGAFRNWGGQSQEAAAAGTGQQPPPSEPRRPSDVAAPAPQPPQGGEASPKEVSEAPAQDPKPKERAPLVSTAPKPATDPLRESASKEGSSTLEPQPAATDPSPIDSQRQEEPAAPAPQPPRIEGQEEAPSKETSLAPAEPPKPQEEPQPRPEGEESESPTDTQKHPVEKDPEETPPQDKPPEEQTPAAQARPAELTEMVSEERLAPAATQSMPQQMPITFESNEGELAAPLSAPQSPLRTSVELDPRLLREEASLEGNFEPASSSEEEDVEEEPLEESSEAASSSEESDEGDDYELPPTTDLTHNGLFERTRSMTNDELREYAERNPANAVLQRWAGLWEDYAEIDVPSLPDLAILMTHPQTTQEQIQKFFLNGTWNAKDFSEAEKLRALTLLGTHYRLDRVHEPQLIQALELYNQHLEGFVSDTDREAIRLLLARSLTSRNKLSPIPSSLLRLVGIHVVPKQRAAAAK